MRTLKTIAAAALAVAAATAGAQAPPTAAKTPEFLSRQFMTPENIAAMNNGAPPQQPRRAAPQSDLASPTDLGSSSMAAAPLEAPAAKPPVAAPSPAPAVPTPPRAAPEPSPEPRPRYVLDTTYNLGSLAHHTDRAATQEALLARRHGVRQTPKASASASPGELVALLPVLEQLETRGIDPRKVDLELRRLNPEQFQRWAREVQR